MLNAEQAKGFAARWVAAWNAHDLEAVLAFYADGAVCVSPVAIKLMGDAKGEVRGKPALRDYFARGFEAYPYMNLQLISTMAGVDSVVIYYANHKGTRTCEYLEFDAAGKVVRDVAAYLV